MTVDLDHLRTWVGNNEKVKDRIDAGHLARFFATLDYDQLDIQEGDPVPPSGHWIYFNSRAKNSDIGSDGHVKRGNFLPPVDLPRRMWAGGRINWRNELRVGEAVTRASTVASVNCKAGKSGDLVFVLVRHQYYGSKGVYIDEEQDIVYRGGPGSVKQQTTVKPALKGAVWTRTIQPDPVLLFRYSALTFNSHRIHYDYKYVTEEEGYPGLIVHGPLLATLLMDLCCRENVGRELKQFNFKAVSPLFHNQKFTVNGIPRDNGKTADLWAANSDGGLAMQAEVEFSD